MGQIRKRAAAAVLSAMLAGVLPFSGGGVLQAFASGAEYTTEDGIVVNNDAVEEAADTSEEDDLKIGVETDEDPQEDTDEEAEIDDTTAVKKLAVGTYLVPGDIIDFGEGVYVAPFRDEDGMWSGETLWRGKRTVDAITYSESAQQYVLTFKGCKYKIGIASVKQPLDANGVEVMGGDGLRDVSAFYFGLTLAALDAHELTQASLTLGDTLSLNFYADNIRAANVNEYSVRFSGKCVNKESRFSLKDHAYCASAEIYANNMDETITATLYRGSEQIGAPLTYSVGEYLAAAAQQTDDHYMKAMICATRLFGSAAAEYFYGGDHGYADALSAYLKEAGKTEAELAASAERYAFDAADAKLALVLDAKTAVRLYVAGVTPGTEADGYIAAANAAQADAPSYFEFTGLRPEDLSAAKTISVNGTAYRFSALSWCDRVLKSGLDADDKNVKMAKALLAYHQAGRELPVRTIAAELETRDDNYESYFIYIYFNYHEGQRWCDIDLPDEIVVDDKYLKWDREELWLFIYLEELDWGDRMIHTDEVIRSDGIYSWHDFDE